MIRWKMNEPKNNETNEDRKKKTKRKLWCLIDEWHLMVAVLPAADGKNFISFSYLHFTKRKVKNNKGSKLTLHFLVFLGRAWSTLRRCQCWNLRQDHEALAAYEYWYALDSYESHNRQHLTKIRHKLESIKKNSEIQNEKKNGKMIFEINRQLAHYKIQFSF